MDHKWPEDFYEEGQLPNPLIEVGIHQECIKANQGKGTHIVAVDSDVLGVTVGTLIFTVAECYCPDWSPRWEVCANMKERVGRVTKRMATIVPKVTGDA